MKILLHLFGLGSLIGGISFALLNSITTPPPPADSGAYPSSIGEPVSYPAPYPAPTEEPGGYPAPAPDLPTPTPGATLWPTSGRPTPTLAPDWPTPTPADPAPMCPPEAPGCVP